MAIASSLRKYLDDRGIRYELISHEPTMTSSRAAQAAHISGAALAKGIMLGSDDGYMLAVLPASRRLQLASLEKKLGRSVHLATEQEVEAVFRDCERGAVPPAGGCYGLNVILDDSLDGKSDLYFEAGDHATLVHMNADEFVRLNPDAMHGSFSAPN